MSSTNGAISIRRSRFVPFPSAATGWGCRSAKTSGTTLIFGPSGSIARDPIESLVAAGAEIIVNVSASPYTIEKRRLRPRMLAATARRWRRPLVFVNQVGGQDDLVFDGASLAFDAVGAVLARGREHESDLVICDIPLGESVAPAGGTAPATGEPMVHGRPTASFDQEDAESALGGARARYA